MYVLQNLSISENDREVLKSGLSQVHSTVQRSKLQHSCLVGYCLKTITSEAGFTTFVRVPVRTQVHYDLCAGQAQPACSLHVLAGVSYIMMACSCCFEYAADVSL